jgi:cysteinyl-tRNA synthetase
MNRDSNNGLKVFNTLTKEIEPFTSIAENIVTMYNCGPTLHSIHTQIGNLRSYTFSDLVKRYLIYLGYYVKHVIKITDVDDHTIAESQKQGIRLRDYTDPLYEDFIKQLQKLNIILPTVLPRVTDNIQDITEDIQKLTNKGYTYVSNGSTYFRVNKVENYGVLANLEKQKALLLNAQKRMEDFLSDEKENINDFCLWKNWTPDEGNIFWNTDFGKGRPGWHVECSVMSRKYLGETVDIHIGGVSHIFPHHTNEIAISEAITKKPFVNYWLHHDYLIVDGESMSKFKGTFYVLSDILNRGYHPMILRYMLIKSHYRQKLDFTWNGMEQINATMLKIVNCMSILESIETSSSEIIDMHSQISTSKTAFQEGMNKDFNVSEALTALFEFISFINKNKEHITKNQAQLALKFIFDVDRVLGFITPYYTDYKKKLNAIINTYNLKELIEKRIVARKTKNYALSDELTKSLFDKGIKFTDLKSGTCCIELTDPKI